MGFLNSLTTYAQGWEVVGRESLKSLDPEGFKEIQSAEVTSKEQEWGTSVSICMFLKGGGQKYVSLARDSNLEVGDKVDVDSIEILTLERDGEEAYKADGEVLKAKGRKK